MAARKPSQRSKKTQTVKGGAEKTYFLQMIFLDQVFDKAGQAKLAFGRQDISREVVFQKYRRRRQKNRMGFPREQSIRE